MAKLSIEQWEDVRDTLTQLEHDYQEQILEGVTKPEAVLRDVRDALKNLVDMELYRQTIIKFLKDADKIYGLNIETDNDGQLLIYTGLVFPQTDDDSLQTFDDLQLMELDDDES